MKKKNYQVNFKLSKTNYILDIIEIPSKGKFKMNFYNDCREGIYYVNFMI